MSNLFQIEIMDALKLSQLEAEIIYKATVKPVKMGHLFGPIMYGLSTGVHFRHVRLMRL